MSGGSQQQAGPSSSTPAALRGDVQDEKSKTHIRHCLLYEYQSGRTAAEATRNLCQAMGAGVISDTTAQKWFSRFRHGSYELEDQPRSGRPADCKEEVLRRLVEADPRQSTRDLAGVLGWSHSSVERHLHSMGKVNKLGSWVPHLLSQRDLDARADSCSVLLSRSRRFDWLDHLITGDEKWCLYVNPSNKRQWLDKGQAAESTPKGELHPKKVMISVWWDVRGIIHWETLPENATVNAAFYCEQLQRLDQALKKCRTKSDKIFFLHDNARPHIAKITRKKLLELGWELLPHPAYSPDLAPSDYHLFRSLQSHLSGRTFDNLRQLKTDLQAFFSSKPESFFKEGIHSLPERWQKVVDMDGKYIVD